MDSASFAIIAVTCIFGSSLPTSLGVPSFVCNKGRPNSELVGLLPFNQYHQLVDPGKEVACNRFWFCRQHPLTLLKRGEFGRSLPIPESYSCAEADPSKPFFNAQTCECVATNDHCAANDNFPYKCTRVVNDTEPEESCRGWGENADYYQGIFPDFQDEGKWWHCSHAAVEGTTYALRKNCSDNGLDLIYNSENNCACDFRGDDGGAAAITATRHPMNRFRCIERNNPEGVGSGGGKEK